MRHSLNLFGRIAVACILTGTALVVAAGPEPVQKGNDKSIGKLPEVDRFIKAGWCCAVTLDKVATGPVGRSLPPVYTHTLSMTVTEVFRGDVSVGAKVEGSHIARQMEEPTFPVGRKCIVSGAIVQERLHVQFIREGTPELEASARLAASVPAGWQIQDGALVSPWAELGEKAWPKGVAAASGTARCARTGRPALLVGGVAKFSAEPVPPEKAIQWTNPDGDGLYKLTLTNPTDKPLEVPALLTDGDKVLWGESLVIICQERGRMAPGAKGVPAGARPVTLKPGESVSGVINALGLPNVEWPQGGYRIEFQFCLGERSVTQSFYYMSRHHDAIRDKSQGKPAVEPADPAAKASGTPASPEAVKPANAAPTRTITAKDANSTVNVKVGDVFAVALDGNPTTGYCWESASKDIPIIVQQGDWQIVRAADVPEGMVGVGGTIVTTFKAAQEGHGTLTMVYRRPWEKDTPPAKTFQVKIVVGR